MLNGSQYPDANVAVEVVLGDGVETCWSPRMWRIPSGSNQPLPKTAPSCYSPNGNSNLPARRVWCGKTMPARCSASRVCKADSVAVEDVRIELKGVQDYIELAFGRQGWRVASGPSDAVREIAGARR